MNITEVRIKLISNPSDRLKAFASVTFDGDFVVRDIKVIDGTTGVFVAMPSRKLADRCPKCGSKNHLRAKYCNDCAAPLPQDRQPDERRGRNKLHADIAHPINTECRQLLQQAIVEAYQQEVEQSKQPGYQPADDDDLAEERSGSGFGDGVDDRRQNNKRQARPAAAIDDAIEEPEDEPEEELEDAEDSEPDDGFMDEVSEGDDPDAMRSDYESMIDDLKRDAQQRRGTRREHRGRDEPKTETVEFDHADDSAATDSLSETFASGLSDASDASDESDDMRDAVTAPPADATEEAADDSEPQDEFGAGII